MSDTGQKNEKTTAGQKAGRGGVSMKTVTNTGRGIIIGGAAVVVGAAVYGLSQADDEHYFWASRDTVQEQTDNGDLADDGKDNGDDTRTTVTETVTETPDAGHGAGDHEDAPGQEPGEGRTGHGSNTPAPGTGSAGAGDAPVAPGSGVPQSGVGTGVLPGGVYMIREGDTLSSVSAKVGVSVDHLAAYNRLVDVNRIYAGSALRVPGVTD